jgi:ParB-like chromosome segregation protein Spo0J
MQIAEQLTPLAVLIDTICLDPNNARLHTELNLNVIKKSLMRYGQRKPIVINRNTGFIEAGNGLYVAAKELGWETIAVVYVDDDKDTAAAYGLMDNKSALLSDWDLPKLKEILNELDSKTFNISSTGFSFEEIEKLLNQVTVERNMSSQLSRGYVEGVHHCCPR